MKLRKEQILGVFARSRVVSFGSVRRIGKVCCMLALAQMWAQRSSAHLGKLDETSGAAGAGGYHAMYTVHAKVCGSVPGYKRHSQRHFKVAPGRPGSGISGSFPNSWRVVISYLRSFRDLDRVEASEFEVLLLQTP